MKFMLMMTAPGQTGDWAVSEWAAQDLQAHIAFMKNFAAGLQESGELVAAEGLDSPRDARIVRASRDGGGAEVTDGPFPETKEFLAGFWIVDCESRERAYEIAAQASAAPGPGGKPIYIPIEVRQVMSAPPVEV